MTNPFYLSRQWRRCRESILRRDDYICQRCISRGTLTAADTVHHKKPLEHYPELAYAESNLISYCGSCHTIIEKRGGKKEDKPQRRARIVKG